MVNNPRQLKAVICPSILNADLADLGNECRKLLEAGADYLHLDVMDGHFVPNITFGHPLIGSLRKKLGEKPFFDVHLMVSDPEKWLHSMHESGTNQFTFHLEAVKDVRGSEGVHSLIEKIKGLNMRCGIALKPATKIEELHEFVSKIDTALIMTVEPGFGGQSFMKNQLEKVKYLRSNFPSLDIQVDGGVGLGNITECAEAGANLIVAGTAIINSKNQADTMRQLRDCVQCAFENKK